MEIWKEQVALTRFEFAYDQHNKRENDTIFWWSLDAQSIPNRFQVIGVNELHVDVTKNYVQT
jgi:hypothetical protein